MQENVKRYLEKLKENRKAHGRKHLVMLACGFFVVCGIFGALILPGLGFDGELICEKKEHTHTEACITCNLAEHTHDENCVGCTLTAHTHDKNCAGCTLDEHVHEAECYNCSLEEHTHDDSCPDECSQTEHTHTAECLSCSQEEHTHTDACAACSLDEHTHTDACAACSLTEHTHTAECYGCGSTEHTHDDSCYGSAYAIMTLDLDDGDDTFVDECLNITMETKDNTSNSGEILQVAISSVYSHANQTGPAKVVLELGTLPDCISLLEFVNGERKVDLQDGSNTVTLYMKKDTDGVTYIEYEQPAGSTLNIELKFKAQNGITPDGTYVSIDVDKSAQNCTVKKISEGVTLDDAQALTLTWNAKNEWSNVRKTVDNKSIAVKLDDETRTKSMLSGSLTYTIKAESLNQEKDTGIIWTDYIIVKDTLTFSDNISFPDGAKKSTDGKSIVTKDDAETIVSFTNLTDEIEVCELNVLDDHNVYYELKVPNTHKVDRVWTQEQDHLSLEMVLNAELLELKENYILKESSEIANDFITNHVEIQPYTCLGDKSNWSEAKVSTNPCLSDEKFELTKSVTGDDNQTDNVIVHADSEVTYTLKLKNTGDTPITVCDEKTGECYKVKDELSDCFYLSNEQLAQIESNKSLEYDENTNTIYWIPSTEKILAGKEVSISFKVKVYDINNEAVSKLENGAIISNTAEYKGESSNVVEVEYQKPVLEIEKVAVDKDGKTIAKVKNGDTIIYKITVQNPTTLNATDSATVEDSLPAGLTFVSATIGDETDIKESGTYLLHQANASETGKCGSKHNIDFSYTTDDDTGKQMLSWSIGCLQAGEVVTVSYVCTVNTDELEDNEKIKNTATLNVKEDSSSSEVDVGVDYPIKLVKQVNENTTKAYPNGSEFNYKITITNDKDNPSEKKDLVLVDTLPNEMIPCDIKLYKVDDSDSGNKTEVAWTDFAASSYSTDGYTFYTEVDGGDKPATVEKENGAIKLTWQIGEMEAGDKITITYKTQLNMSEEHATSGKTYEYTNTATIDELESSQTIRGGIGWGSLTIKKDFTTSRREGPTKLFGFSTRDAYPDTEFVITGIDIWGNEITFEDGKTQKVIGIDEFTDSGSIPPAYTYTLTNLPAGTYTVEERNYEKEDKRFDVTTYTNTNMNINSKNWKWKAYGETSCSVSVSEGLTSGIYFSNSYEDSNEVKLQKSVYEIGKLQNGSKTWNSIPDKELFAVDDSNDTTTYVVYNLTVTASGASAVQIESLKDQLPNGLKYVGMCSTADYTKNADSFTNEITTSGDVVTYYGNQRVITYVERPLNDSTDKEEYVLFYDGVKITSEYDSTADNVVEFKFDFGSDNSNTLYCGEVISFLVLCEVDKSVVAGQKLTNTAELVVSGDVTLKNSAVYETKNTPYDANQNNGDTVLVDTRENGEHDRTLTITSAVTIIPENTIVPGVEKNAISYILPGMNADEEIELGEESSISSLAAVKWEIEIYNDGTKTMQDYEVEDVVTSDFHMITEAEAARYGITKPYTYQLYDYNNNKVGDEQDISSEVWKTVTDDSVNKYTFNFTGETYAIPSGYHAVLTFYTNNTIESNKVYKNTATLLPSQEFVANNVRHGELKVNEDGEYIGVADSDEVYALGEFGSISWKTITEKGNSENTASGSQKKNYISVGLDSLEVIYTNNIKNISKKDFNNFVVIDLLPMKNDTGVINRSDKRGSEFSVFYNEGLIVQVIDGDDNVSEVSSEYYDIEFSSKTGYTENDFDGVESERWHDEWETGDRSFRIIFKNNFYLHSGETLVIQYEGKIESTATPGAIAWNSFGYQYYSGTTSLRAEPPKVGVMIPTVPIIQKEVVDLYGQVQERDAKVQFGFELYKLDDTTETKLCDFTLCQGDYLKLSELQDGDRKPIVFENGQTYMVKEKVDTMPKGYELVGIGEKGGTLTGQSYTFTYYDYKDINILVRNKVTKYVSELPETGGMSAFSFKLVGTVIALSAVLLGGYKLRGCKKKSSGVMSSEIK